VRLTIVALTGPVVLEPPVPKGPVAVTHSPGVTDDAATVRV